MTARDPSISTRLCHSDPPLRQRYSLVNPPIYRASTVIFPTLADFEAAQDNPIGELSYGIFGTPTTEAFERTMAELEGADHAIALPSGLAAITVAFLTFLKAGDHILVPDNVYGPARDFCDHFLTKMEISTGYYDPCITDAIQGLITPQTRILYMESPGSLTFEVQDVGRLAAIAHSRNMLAILDNSWATPIYFRPYDHGVDVTIHAGTKYISGHSDLLSGIITCRTPYYAPLKRVAHGLGFCVSPEEAYLALRGLRTLPVRLEKHYKNARILVDWVTKHRIIKEVFYPALEGDPGYRLWQRDFLGAGGLFSIRLDRRYHRDAIAAMLDPLHYFSLGYSWGGYESLILPIAPARSRTVTHGPDAGTMFRLFVGLEDPQDLIADLEAGLERLCKGQ